jgi:hypothetical protein
LKCLSRKLGDITNDDDVNNHSSGNTSKRRRKSPSSDSDEPKEDTVAKNRADEHFVFQAGHKFFLLYAPWIRSGDALFETSIDEHYVMAERFENDDNKSQGQLKEILDLLKAKFQPQSDSEALCLRQRWIRRQVSGVHISKQHITYL